MGKIKTKLTIDAFRATQSVLHLIPSPRILLVDEGSPLQNSDDIPEEPLPSSPPKFAIDENMQHILSVLNEQHDKGKKPISEFPCSKTRMKERTGWSKEEINQALEESIRIQAFKENSNMMLGLSPLCHDGIIHDLDIVLFMYSGLPNQDLD